MVGNSKGLVPEKRILKTIIVIHGEKVYPGLRILLSYMGLRRDALMNRFVEISRNFRKTSCFN